MDRQMIVATDRVEALLKAMGTDDDAITSVLEQAVRASWDAVNVVATDNGDGTYTVSVQQPTGVMVALMLPDWAQDRVCLPGGTQSGDLHITLAYLGDVDGLSLAQQRTLIGVVGEVASKTQCIRATLAGTGTFPPADADSPTPLWVGVEDCPGLLQLHADLQSALKEAGFEDQTRNGGTYVPHVTVAWVPKGRTAAAMDFQPLDVQLDDLAVCIGPQRVVLDLPDDYGPDYDEPYQSGWTPTALAKAVSADEEKRYTLGPWYPPMQKDAHGEWSDREEIEKAFHAYMALPDADIRLQHNVDIAAGRRVDGVVWPFEVTVPMTKSDGTTEEVTFPAGTPFMGTVWEPWAFDLVKQGKITGYSIGGRTKKLQVDMPVEVAKAALTSAAVNDLPDSAFAYIEPGGKKGADGKTTPRSKRHFPIHDAAHVKNALARLATSPFGPKAKAKVDAAARRLGIGDH